MSQVPEGFPMFDKEAQTGRVWACRAGSDPCSRKQPCRSCMGRRSRRKGQVKQRAAAKALKVPSRRYASQNAHEEGFGGTLRIEVKAEHPRRPGVRTSGQAVRNRIAGFIESHVRANGYPPSVREIGLAVGLKSSSTVHAHLAQMQRDGVLVSDPSRARAIRLVLPDAAPVVPMEGES